LQPLCGIGAVVGKIRSRQNFCLQPHAECGDLARFQLAIADMVLGVMLIDLNCPSIRWQGSSAIEEIAKLLPNAAPFVHLYLQIKPIKWLGDRTYEQIRNHRYALFGKRSHTFVSEFAPICAGDRCQRLTLPQGVG
jgi:Protein of unknown function, DUF393.